MTSEPLTSSTARRRVSAVILTLNEERNLSRCIASLGWCDEIVVIDSGSTDRTAQVASQLGARVLTHVQVGTFLIAEQRNWALAHPCVTGDWVLFLDADEVVPASLASAILTIAAEKPQYDAYELTPRYMFWGRWLKRTQGYPNWHPRIVRRGYAFFTGGVWETFTPGARVGRITAPYDHYANSKGFHDWLERHDRYSTWDAERVVAFLDSRDPHLLGTTRKVPLRKIAGRLWPARPVARFLHMYLIRAGILEGIPGLVFSGMYAAYEFMTVIKIAELRRVQRGEPL